jgi:hypothetical protein
MPTKNSALALVVTAALVGVAGPAAAGTGGAAEDKGPSKAQLAKVRAATAKYKDVKKAIADGYIATSACEESKAGSMGFHYMHPQRAMDGKADITKPDFLLYGPKKGGGVQLNGVEYFLVDADQNLQTRNPDLPKVLGHEFDGPMPGHVKGMPIHNDLHVWLYKKNPRGMFTPDNPRVSCP